MIIKVLRDFIQRKDKTRIDKIKTIYRLIKHFFNLLEGLRTSKIYHSVPTQQRDLQNLFEKLTNSDLELFRILFKEDVEKFLQKNPLTNLDFDKKIGLSQIGYNCIYVSDPLPGFWTTGRSTFYIPTRKGMRNRIILNMLSIVPLGITIGFEDATLEILNMSILETRRMEIEIEPAKITKDISEIFVNTDRLWNPGLVTGIKDSIRVGVCIKSIHVYYS